MAIWLLIATVGGLRGPQSRQGQRAFSACGATRAFGLLGVFLIGTLLNAFNFSMSTWIAGLRSPARSIAVTYWVDLRGRLSAP